MELIVDKSRITPLGDGAVKVNAADLGYKDLNHILRAVCSDGAKRIELVNVNGQRYIGTDLPSVLIEIHGTAGNNLGAFMNGPEMIVHGNAQDGVGNTMNKGLVVVHGHSSDIAGFAMRGGKVFIRDSAGYRCGIHMKEYKDQIPVLVVGGVAHDFLGEYMAGGVLIVLNRYGQGVADSPGGGNGSSGSGRIPSHFIGTGMHGGVMYLRGEVEDYQLGKEVAALPLEDADLEVIHREVQAYAEHFSLASEETEKLLKSGYTKLRPVSHRPYGKMYAY